ncbi:MAG: beta-N-acetylglucosaminidase domain-containing protein [Anaerolineae bacterium]|nr:beta-N-acetylglucosaminidase domain-containing protein [Anaerolineae bacterium]
MSMFGTRPHDPPPGVLPTNPEDHILPHPQQLALNGRKLRLTQNRRAIADLVCDTNAQGQEANAISWLRRELRQAYGWEPAASGSGQTHLVVGVAKPGAAAQVWAERLSIIPPTQPESYALRIGSDHVVLIASEGIGLLRGVTTLVQLLAVDRYGELYVRCGEITDWPELPLRILIGWVRSDPRPREIIDLAFRYKYNRVFYGLWNWTSGERLTSEDRWLVEYARKHGVELMLQLSRLSFADGFDATNPQDVARVVAVYDEGVEAGFRSFGILFDDQTLQSVEAELNLTLAIYRRLTERLGNDFEFTFIPEVYWLPGELAGWPPQPERAEEFRLAHTDYLQKIGAALPGNVEVFIANNWNDYPVGYAETQEKEFNALARRKPIFFENQITNDYRRSIILPFPVHNRPVEFATAMRGYGLNMPMPYSAYYPSMITCAALAWNPAGYDAGLAWGAALQQHFGAERAALVLDGLNALNRLFVEWTQPYFPAASHYGSLHVKLKEGKLTVGLVQTWRARLGALKAMFCAALVKTGEGTETLRYYVEEMERLDLDMALLADVIQTRAELAMLQPEHRPASLAAYRARQEGRYHKLLSILAHRSPPTQRLQMMLLQSDGTSLFPNHKPSQIPAGWWLSYFYVTMKDEIDGILRVAEEILTPLVADAPGGKV